MKWGVVVFPGSNCDADCVYVIRDVLGDSVQTLWHQDTDLRGVDAVVLPGGFSYGDYLRTGAIARFSPIMQSITAFAKNGGLVLGICNGFQILLESGLLPGAMLRNTGLRFICRTVTLRVDRTDTPFTNRYTRGQVVRMPIAHNEGRFAADPATIKRINQDAVFRYCNEQGEVTEEANPNGSSACIAGITNQAGNVMGLMPHPERASELSLGGDDGRLVFESMRHALAGAR